MKKLIENEEKTRIILKTWDEYLKNQKAINKLFWELDLFLVVRSISENLVRLKSDNLKLNADLKILLHELHYLVRNKSNRVLIDNASPSLISAIRRLYWFDGKKLEFKRNDKNYSSKKRWKNGYSPESIFSLLYKYTSRLRNVIKADSIIESLLQPNLNKEQIIQYTKYLLQSLLFDYKRDRSTLRKKLNKSLIRESFETIKTEILKEIVNNQEKIANEASAFIINTLDEIKNDTSLDFKNFIERIMSGQSTQQKDYAYNVYGFISGLSDYSNSDNVQNDFRANIIELFFRIILYTHLSTDYHKHDPLDDRRDRDKSYKDLLDNVYRLVMPKVNFLKDHFETFDPNRLPPSTLANFKEPITQEYIAKKSLHSKFRDDLWYKVIISFSKGLYERIDIRTLELKSPEIMKRIMDSQRIYGDITFTDFNLLNELLEGVNKDFSILLSQLRKGELLDTSKELEFRELTEHIFASLSTGHYDSFIRNIDFNQFTDKQYAHVIKKSLGSLTPEIQEYRVITTISHIDLEGEVKKIDDNIYLYDARKWDSGENNQLDFFKPSNFKGPHQEYADIKYASPFYFMASHTGWGQSINPDGKMARHSTRLISIERAYSVDEAVYKSFIRANKLKTLLITPWTYYTNTRQSANIKLSNQFFIVNHDFTDYNFKDLNHSDTFDEDKLTLKSESYKNFDSVYIPLLSSDNYVDQNILESLNYWLDAIWEKMPEKKFFLLIKALSSILGVDPTSSRKGGEKIYLDILASASNSQYWRDFLHYDIVNFWKKINDDKDMKKAYLKIVRKSTYYLDLLKNIDIIRNNSAFSKVKPDLDNFYINYDKPLLVGNTRYLRNTKELELIIWKTKRHSVLHHDNVDAYDAFDIPQYNWKLEKIYRRLFIEILQARNNGSKTYNAIISSLNL